jgi:hypothetical protein
MANEHENMVVIKPDEEEMRVPIEDLHSGATYYHIMKPILYQEKKRFEKMCQRKIKTDGGRVRGPVLEVEVNQWRKSCIRVEELGIEENGKVVDISTKTNWQDIIVNHRSDHCRIALNYALGSGSLADEDSEDDEVPFEKDSGPPSEPQSNTETSSTS